MLLTNLAYNGKIKSYTNITDTAIISGLLIGIHGLYRDDINSMKSLVRFVHNRMQLTIENERGND